jgi:hypothetical protein
MADHHDLPSKEDLERFRSELVEELKLTREEVREAFNAAAEPLRKEFPMILERIAALEARVEELEARQFEPWPKPPVC